MAVAKLVCSDCGAGLLPGDSFCPQCGAKIEPTEGARETTPVRCPVCGHSNKPGNKFCESCGARLSKDRAAASPGGAGGRSQNKPSRQQPAENAGGAKRKFEPWPFVAGFAVIALVAYLVYTEVSGDGRQPVASKSSVPPVQSMPAVPPIEPFEKAVAANPDDPNALLQLANVLHDNRAFGRAIETYKMYLAKVPKNSDARVDMGICYFQLAQEDSINAGRLFPLALQEMETAYKANPNHQPAAFNLGIVNLNIGNLQESNKWFKRAVELNKNSDLGARAQRILDQHSIIQ